MNKLRTEVFLRRGLVVVVAFMWATFFGVMFKFTPLMVFVVALMSLWLLQFWDD